MSARATIEVLEGGTRRVVDVGRDGLTIGRAGCGLILDAPSVSTEHARLFWRGDDLMVEDAGSRYGTRRDGVVLRTPTLVKDGDELLLGGAVVLRVTVSGAEFGAPVTDLADTQGLLAPVVGDLPERVPSMSELLRRAQSEEELAHRAAASVRELFQAQRVALLGLEPGAQRFRTLGLAGATATSFVSRTVVADAAARGLALHVAGSGREIPSVVTSGATSAAAAAVQGADGRTRVLYVDRTSSPPLDTRDALAIHDLAGQVGAALDMLAAQNEILEHRLRFRQLSAYLPLPVVDHVLREGGDLDRPRQLRVTVLFADLCGYTKLSERLGATPDRYFGILNGWLEAGARAVMDHHGTLDKFIGDAVMAVFGAPFPIPDDALAAVRCATAMHAAAAALAAETGEELSITVGINSGDVLAGSVGTRRRLEYTVFGDTVNVASRLQGHARPGETLVGPATAEAVAGKIAVVSVGPLPLKNRAEPVTAYRVASAP